MKFPRGGTPLHYTALVQFVLFYVVQALLYQDRERDVIAQLTDNRLWPKSSTEMFVYQFIYLFIQIKVTGTMRSKNISVKMPV